MALFGNHKCLLNFCNLLFLGCGISLIISGFYLFRDTKRILLSRLLAATSEKLNDLPQPLFYYIAIGVTVAGLVALLASIVGFWASCSHTYCFLSLYFLTVVVLLLAESVVCLAITLWPHCLGISLDEKRMVKALQTNYGVPGKEQFTIAMDLAQLRFGCCGMQSNNDYEMSQWRLQTYGQRDWRVPLTCCVLKNANTQHAYLDPQPANESLCQAQFKADYERDRFTEVCLNHLDHWYREQFVVFLGASLLLAAVEFAVLLVIVLNCTHISTKSLRIDDQQHRTGRSARIERLSLQHVENIYEPELEIHATNLRLSDIDDRHAITDFQEEMFKEAYVQPRELYKQRHNTTFKPSSNDYNLPTHNYLV